MAEPQSVTGCAGRRSYLGGAPAGRAPSLFSIRSPAIMRSCCSTNACSTHSLFAWSASFPHRTRDVSSVTLRSLAHCSLPGALGLLHGSRANLYSSAVFGALVSSACAIAAVGPKTHTDAIRATRSLDISILSLRPNWIARRIRVRCEVPTTAGSALATGRHTGAAGQTAASHQWLSTESAALVTSVPLLPDRERPQAGHAGVRVDLEAVPSFATARLQRDCGD